MASYAWGEEEEDRFGEGQRLTSSELIELFLASKVAANKIGKRAEEDYKSKLSILLRYSDAEGVPPQKWGKRQMARQIARMRAEGKTAHTIRRFVVVAKTFFSWLYKERLFQRNLLEHCENPVVRSATEEHTVAATRDDLDGWLRANKEFWLDQKHGSRFHDIRACDFFMLRDQLIALTIADTAIRPVELFRVRTSQVKQDPEGWYIELFGGQTKTGRPRILYWSVETVEYALKPWLEIRSRVKFGSNVDEGWLVCGERADDQGHTDLDSQTWSRQFGRRREFAREKGYIPSNKRITPYSFRRYAIEMIDRVSVIASMAIAGHEQGSGLDVHARYNKGVDISDLESASKAQQEAQTRIAHRIASPVGGLKHLKH